MSKWKRDKFDEHDGYDCMTGGINVGPALLDGSKYGQKSNEPITPEQMAEMEKDARIIEAAPEMLDAAKTFCRRVEAGEVRSRRTYKIFKDLLEKVESGAPCTRRPRIVCLCGSTRFAEAFQRANLTETIAGHIVLSIGCNTKSDSDLIALGELTEDAKARLDELHKRKIDLADEILVLNVGGYIGDSTRSEVNYAAQNGKAIRYLEPRSVEAAQR